MLCKVSKRLINKRFIFAAFDYCRFEIIRHNSCRNTAEVMKSILASPDQVFFFLAVYSFYIRKLAAPQYGNKYFDLQHLSTVLIRNTQLLSGKIYIHFIACLMLYMHYRLGTFGKMVVVLIKLGDGIPLRMGYTVLLPDQRNSHSLAPHL